MEESNNPNQRASSPSSQHPIPQNFMDVEFKIIGDFTFKQFVYLCVFGGPAYVIFGDTLINPIIKWPLFIFLVLLTITLVAVPIEDRGADEWIVNFVRSVFGHNERVWVKNPSIPQALSIDSIKFIQAGWIATTSTTNRRKVEEYIGRISEEEFKSDIDDFNFKQRAFVEAPVSTKTVIEQEYRKIIEEQKKPSTPEISTISEQPKTPEVATKAFEEIVLINPFTKPKEELVKETRFVPKVIPTEEKIILTPEFKKIETKDPDDNFRTSNVNTPGRKFVSFSKMEAEELILPIRGEASINIFEKTPIVVPKDMSSTKNIQAITRELEDLTKKAKKEYELTEETPTNNLATNSEILIEKIEGTVIDEQNRPLPKVNLELLIKSNLKTLSSQTDTNGRFVFKVSEIGEMQIKVRNAELYGLKFDIINFEVKEYPYHSFMIVGRK